MHFRRPDVEVRGEVVTVFSVREREPVRLAMQHQPFCVSFSYFSDSGVFVVDSTLLEEQCRDGEIIVTMNRFGEVCQIAKYGGAPVEGLSFLTCTNLALEKVKMMDKFVKSELEKDEKKRDRGGLMAELSAENAR